jgi:4-diphosphocytidyl-2-C-methyl-D-erythritol kinase
MRGIGEKLSDPLALPPLAAVLVNPGTALATRLVFAGWTPPARPAASFDLAAVAKISGQKQLLQLLTMQPNDLESAAILLAPVIADVLAVLRGLAGCGLARMSGSGSTCFGLFSSAAEAAAAARLLEAKHPDWWVRETVLG